MTTLKILTIVAALLAGGTSLAIAQNGPATGGQPPVAGGANGGSRVVAGMLVVRLWLQALPTLVCLLSALPPLQVSALLNRLRPR